MILELRATIVPCKGDILLMQMMFQELRPILSCRYVQHESILQCASHNDFMNVAQFVHLFSRTISLPLGLPSQAYLTVTRRQATILRVSRDKQFFSNTLDPWEGDNLAAMVIFKKVEVFI